LPGTMNVISSCWSRRPLVFRKPYTRSCPARDRAFDQRGQGAG
jgi:hypothetical protein